MDLALNFFVIFLISFIWRLIFIIKSPHRGCDPYYYLLYIEEFRKQKKLPVILPDYFVLQDTKQVYPPGFVMLCSLLPDSFFRFYWIVSPLIDSIICSLLFAGMTILSGSYEISSICILIYVFSNANLAEVVYFTSRQLGVLLHSLTVICYFAYLSGYLGYEALVVSVLFGICLLMSHKLSTQAFFMGMFLLSLCSLSLNPIFLVATVISLTIVFSNGFYIQILKGHWHLISHWTKYSMLIGLEPLLDSPIYGGDPFSSKRSHYAKPFKELLIFAFRFYFLRENLYIILSFILLCIHYLGFHHVPYFYLMCALWSTIIFFIGLLTYLVPFLRGIGFMMQYGKLAMPTGLIVFLYSVSVPDLTLIAYLIILYYIYWALRKFIYALKVDFNTANASTWNLRKMYTLFDVIKKLDDPLIMSVPVNYCDVIAYRCRKRVFTGGHNPALEDYQIIYPLYLDTIENIVDKYGITHLLLDTNTVSLDVVNLKYKQIWSNDNLIFFETNQEGNVNAK